MKGNYKKVANPLDEIKRIEQKREERRVKMEDMKREKEYKKAYNLASGKNVDIDFEIMIDKNRFKEKMLSPHVSSVETKLSVCVRKRPVFKKYYQAGYIDSISSANPQIRIHEPKFKVDGITKYVYNHTFTFDNTFNELEDTADVYNFSIKPLLPLLVANGIVTCFAYGQTGSGKTFTMNQIQELLVSELFQLTNGNFEVAVSFFEIYAGRCLDLLNDKNLLNILEDKSNNIQIQGITEKATNNAKYLLQIIEMANSVRTTHSTAANDTSSRSHAICQVLIRQKGSDVGKLVLVDLAGSERAQDTQSNNRQRRMYGAEINKSLLALKECIRAMGDKADHVPFRASKLTLILRDSFINKQNKSKVVMIACVSPGSSSADHSLNTLRYADRLKDNSDLQKIYNEMHDNVYSEDVQNEFSKDHIQKIESLKNIRQDKDKSKDNSKESKEKENPKETKEKENSKDLKEKEVKPTVPEKKPPSVPNQSLVNNNSKRREYPKKYYEKKEYRKEEKKYEKKDEKKEEKDKKNQRSISSKKTGLSAPFVSKYSQNDKKVIKGGIRVSSEKENEEYIEEYIEEEQRAKIEKEKQDQKRKAREDVNIMKSTMKGNNVGEEYFAFQEKVSNILEEQEELFKAHMMAIRYDAKLLTQESELISKAQGKGFMDFDIDSYVDKMQRIVAKKLKMYNLLSSKVYNFKKCLTEYYEIRHNVKDTFYF